MEAFERLKQIIAGAEDDVSKADGGNRAAGTRVRQAMQQVKEAAQKVRQDILDMRGGEKEAGEKTETEGKA